MTVSVGVIGTGMIGTEHVRRLAGEVAGRPSRRSSTSRRTGPPPWRGGGRQGGRLLGALVDDPGVDAVLDRLPGRPHAEQVLACHGRRQAGVLREAARDHRRRLRSRWSTPRSPPATGWSRSASCAATTPGTATSRRSIDAGAIGEPLLAARVHRNPSVPDAFIGEMSLTDTAVHEIDTLRWLLGQEIIATTVVPAGRARHGARTCGTRRSCCSRRPTAAVVDVEVFVNCQYGYDIRCEVVGSSGTGRRSTTRGPIVLRGDGRRGEAVPPDWRVRFADGLRRRAAGLDRRRRGPARPRPAPRRLGRLRRHRDRRDAPSPRSPAARTEVQLVDKPGALRTEEPAMKIALDPYMFRSTPLLELPGASWPTSATSTSSCRRARTSCRSSCTRAPTAHDRRPSRRRSTRAGVRIASRAAALPVVRARRGRAAGRRPVLEARDPDHRRPRVPRDELGVQRPSRAGEPSARRSSGGRWRSCSRSSSGRASQLRLEPHPDDFVEDGLVAVDMVRGDQLAAGQLPLLRSAHLPPWAATWSQIMEYAGDLLTQRAPRRLLRPHGLLGPALHPQPARQRRPRPPAPRHRPGRGRLGRVLRHPERARLRRRDGTIMTACVFAWEERARESSRFMREQIRRLHEWGPCVRTASVAATRRRCSPSAGSASTSTPRSRSGAADGRLDVRQVPRRHRDQRGGRRRPGSAAAAPC